MALHELATNSLKYGALSNDEGMMRLSWSRDDDRLHLVWREQGGPPVEPPIRRGFGSRLIERGLPHQLNGTVSLSFLPEGVVCTIDMPLRTPG
jgi:two-component sensor histidine kinase